MFETKEYNRKKIGSGIQHDVFNTFNSIRDSKYSDIDTYELNPLSTFWTN